jgi:hypothetical protein
MESGVMDKEKINVLLESLRKVKQYCDYMECDYCLFKLKDGCMFFNKPYDWEIGLILEKIN